MVADLCEWLYLIPHLYKVTRESLRFPSLPEIVFNSRRINGMNKINYFSSF